MKTFVAARPKALTTHEAFIDKVREQIFRDGSAYKILAAKTGVAQSTIHNFATGKTRWPRPTTLFPLLKTLGLEMRLVRKQDRE